MEVGGGGGGGGGVEVGRFGTKQWCRHPLVHDTVAVVGIRH